MKGDNKTKGTMRRGNNQKRSRYVKKDTSSPCDRRDTDYSTENFNAQKSKPNDPRWYAQNEQLLRDSASFPYSWPLGNQLNLGAKAPEVNKGSIPGIMALYTSGTFGWADNPNAPVNVAARNIYSYVRHANSGHANYDAPDLMLYLCAMDSIYSYLSYLKRIYGVVSTYSYVNRYYPKAAVQAMGVDFDNIQANLADFRAYINSFAVKVGSMCIPASMSYMAKHMWMYEGLYTDSAQLKAQTYMFSPRGFYKYVLDADGAGALVWRDLYHGWPNPNNVIHEGKLSDLIAYGNELLDPVLRSEDMNIMSGDILKAFGAQNVYLVSGISETYTVLPSYVPEVLDQIQNATCIGIPAVPGSEDSAVNTSTAMRLVQDKTKGWLTSTPQFQHPFKFSVQEDEHPGQNVFVSRRIVTFEQDNVTPAMTMEATRLTNIAKEYVEEGTNTYEVHTLGSECVLYAAIFYFAQDSSGKWSLHRSDPIYCGRTNMLEINSTGVYDAISEGMDASQVTAAKEAVYNMVKQAFISIRDELSRNALLIEQLSQFNRHPFVAITTGIQDVSTTSGALRAAPAYSRFNGMVFDVNNYAILDEDDLKVMSETALMSEFNITQYGRSAQ